MPNLVTTLPMTRFIEFPELVARERTENSSPRLVEAWNLNSGHISHSLGALLFLRATMTARAVSGREGVRVGEWWGICQDNIEGGVKCIMEDVEEIYE